MSTPAQIPHSTAPATGGFISSSRTVSIDALRGLIVFTMIFVNDLAGVSSTIVPAWLRHFHGKNGMTFVDLVFPAFLFIVGMSIPFALGSRLREGEPVWKVLQHVLVRTASLLAIGILMVHETPSTEKMGWSGTTWTVLMYGSALLAFSTITWPGSLEKSSVGKILSATLRIAGLAGLIWLAVVFRGDRDQRVISFAPFSIHTSWYGILGLIGWAYLVGSLVFVCFRLQRTALLGCMALLLCLYPASRTNVFGDFWLNRLVGIGEALGSLPSITVAGLLLSTILLTPESNTAGRRVRFTLLFIAGCAAAALLLNGLYGISKNNGTPSWCLWSCAITAALWLVFHWFSDLHPVGFLSKPCALAGQNVLLAYLLSEAFPSVLELTRLGGWYGRLAEPSLGWAVARSAGCGVVILALTAGLNRLGFRLRL